MLDERSPRVCPHCGEEISAKASRCKYCLESVDPIQPSPSSPMPSLASTKPTASASPPMLSAAVPSARGQSRLEYHVVPFIGTMRSGFFNSDNAQTVSEQLQNLIDNHAQHGWEFYSLEKVDVKVAPGCVGQFLGQNASYITFDQVIFRREILD